MPTRHHLFVSTNWLLKAAAVLSVVVLSLALGGLLVAATNLDGNHLGIPASVVGVARIDVLVVGGLAVAGGLLSFILILLAIRATKAIVQTAISGDPFVNDNATRLNQIGWLLLALFAVELASNVTVNSLVNKLSLINKLAIELHVPVSAIGKFTFGPDVSPIGLLAILLIFVLAQIFRRGSEMRAELKGTV